MDNFYMSDQGQIHLYTGNGKGKTTAAFGLALRALMSGKKVAIFQFVKDMKYSETKISQYLENIDIFQLGTGCIFDREINNKDIEAAVDGLNIVQKAIASDKYNLIILDEICIALHLKLLKVKNIIDILQNKPKSLEIVLTGRYAPQELLEISDLVTEMKEIKHYYHKGVKSRKGIEF